MKKILNFCFVIFFLSALFFLFGCISTSKTFPGKAFLSEEEKAFFKEDWKLFYGTLKGPWFSHKKVDVIAEKLLKLDNVEGREKKLTDCFPFRIMFVSSCGKKTIVWFNSRRFSFDRKRSFPHNLTDEEIEIFYLDTSRYHVKNPEINP